VRLIRNHEDRNLVNQGSVPHDPDSYDHSAGGGTSTLDYDPRSRTLVRDFISLSGSHVNCAGGYGLHGKSWLTGEETVYGPEFAPDPKRRHPKRHGYVFEVPLRRRPGHSDGQPLKAMGRFLHEALATDERSGIVYETEDPGSGRGAGFYRFLPRDPHRLRKGGRLPMLQYEEARSTPGARRRRSVTAFPAARTAGLSTVPRFAVTMITKSDCAAAGNCLAMASAARLDSTPGSRKPPGESLPCTPPP